MSHSYLTIMTTMTKVCLLLLIQIITLSSMPTYANNPRNHVGFYIESYGRVDPEENAHSKLAHHIFNRIKNVAGGSQRGQAQLEIVNSPHDPWAISLPDNYIVLSKGAVDLCYKLEDQKEACLAFILGHEMAHIANNDFWHQQVSRFLSSKNDTKPLLSNMGKRADNELKADDDGFIYAAMAGYPVEKLLQENSNGGDFFHYWSQQTSAHIVSHTPPSAPSHSLSAISSHSSSPPSSHPSPNSPLSSSSHTPLQKATIEIRANLLRERLTQIKDKLAYFQFGVRLAHFDYCDDAVHFFADFQTVFPGREVLNNLGFCYLQIARQKMSPARAYFYWLPLQLEGETRAAALTQRGGQKPTKLKEFTIGSEQADLDRAVKYLKQSVDNDPYYLPSRINLAVAYLYNNQPHNARAVLDEARSLAPDNTDVQGLEALSIYEQGDSQINLLPNALARLEKLSQKADVPDSILFNLTRLLQLSGKNSAATPYLKRLQKKPVRLPAPIISSLCEAFELYGNTCQQKKSLSSMSSMEQTLTWPLPTQQWQQLTPKVKAELSNWQHTQFSWGADSLEGHIYRQPNSNAEVIVIDQFIQMQIVKPLQDIPLELMQAHCKQTLLKRQLPAGDVWSCGHWAALSIDKNVKELWWVAR